MNDKQVLRYLTLLDRKIKIGFSGINWKPEYAAELEQIDKEIAMLREFIDSEHEKRQKNVLTAAKQNQDIK